MINYNLPDKLSKAVTSSLQSMESGRILQRIREHDYTVWESQPDEISNRLDWLDSPDEMGKYVGRIEEFDKSLRDDGYDHAFLLGMGGSSLAPEVYKNIFGIKDGFLTLEIIDTTDPDAINAITQKISPEKTLFIVSTKSGGTIETLSLFKYFYNQVSESLGIKSAGEHFVAITDPGSPLETIAKSYNFRDIFLNNPNIGGRYSALSFFGLVPAALVGIDISVLLERAKTTAQKIKFESSYQKNDGMMLGTIIGEAANQGINKLTFYISPEISSYGDWVEQLIAESTGKSGKGILPIVGELPGHDVNVYGKDRLFVFITLNGDDSFNQLQVKAETADHPTIRIELNDIYDLGRLIFLWEIATSVAGYIIKIHPFNQPNVESAKILAREMINTFQKGGKKLSTKTKEFSLSSLLEFINENKPRDYIAIHAYLPPSTTTTLALQKLQEALRNRYYCAVTWGYGPRFLHSTGQLHKGDSGGGLFVQLISTPKIDIPIPLDAGKKESNYTFGMLKLAEAYGDAEALKKVGRKVISFTITETNKDVISTIAEEVKIA